MAAEVLRVPLLNANEDELVVAGLFVSEGDRVNAGALLLALESTKATSDVHAPAAGYVRGLRIAEDQRVAVGDVICFITETADEPLPELDGGRGAGSEGEVRATAKARRLAEAHGIALEDVPADGIVKERDVRELIEARGPAAAPSPAPTPTLALPGRAERAVVLGAGGHARVIIDLARQAHPGWELSVVDDAPSRPADVLGAEVVGDSSALARLREDGVRIGLLGVGAVTNNAARIALFDKLEAAGFIVPSLVHPRAMVEPSVRMGRGNQVFAGAVIGSNARLGDNTIINSGVVVSHDCLIHSHAHLTPGAILAGGVTIGENSVVGMGVTVYLGVTIGRSVVISNGVHVMQDVPDGAIVRARS